MVSRAAAPALFFSRTGQCGWEFLPGWAFLIKFFDGYRVAFAAKPCIDDGEFLDSRV